VNANFEHKDFVIQGTRPERTNVLPLYMLCL